MCVFCAVVDAARGRGIHTDSSANKAGLYVVGISLRTLSDVPACGNGNQAKPQTWQAEGKGCMSVAANMLPGTCTVRAFKVYSSSTRSSPESVSGGVNLYSMCVFVCVCFIFQGFLSEGFSNVWVYRGEAFCLVHFGLRHVGFCC